MHMSQGSANKVISRTVAEYFVLFSWAYVSLTVLYIYYGQLLVHLYALLSSQIA